MKVIDTNIADVKLLEPRVFEDERGFFFESFNQRAFEEAVGREIRFVQDNHSRSLKGTLRGLHYQVEPYAQGKLVRCVRGEVFDVAVDLRESSPTFGVWTGAILSEKNKRQLWIPEGFAHGFMVLSADADFVYKTTNYWHKESERSVSWSDGELGITWPEYNEVLLSDKDAKAVPFKEAEYFR
ncbi:dTDP-4-dehydrorhamnose 3,5-epimerase [Chitinibacteraceae bacterium HSL-7]